MTLSELRIVARAMIPGATESVISNAVLDLMLNAGVKEITAYTECLPTNKKFNAVDSQGDIANPYVISTVIGDYLSVAGGGLWWNENTAASPKWKKLNPVTVEWLDENRPNWHEIDDGTPEDYAIDGDYIYTIPAPDASLASGFWLFYTEMPTAMVATSSYPFSGSTTSIRQLEKFDMAIIYYAKWKLHPTIGQATDADVGKRDYITELKEKNGIYRRRSDIAQTAILQGPAIR